MQETTEARDGAAAPQLTGDDVRQMPCPNCSAPGGTFSVHPIEELVRVGDNCVIATIEAAECAQCGYAIMDIPNTQKLEGIVHRLERGEVGGWTQVGSVYRAP